MKAIKNILSLLAVTVLFAGTAFAGGTPDNPRVIEITGSDNMKFDVTKIEAVPGETIKVVLKVVSKIPKQAMGHNIVFLKKDVDMLAFVNASAMAMSNDYIAPEFEDNILAHTAMAGGGETVEVTFTVPEIAGDYGYVCSFPGHYYGGMVGVLSVKDIRS